MGLKIKICGNRYADQAMLVAAMKPDFMGWIFAPESPRRVSPRTAGRIIERIRRQYPGILHVAVFARNRFEEILPISSAIKADRVQIVGDLPLLHRFSGAFGDRLLPAIRVEKEKTTVRNAPGALIIVDSFVPGQSGGTGKRFTPQWIAGLSRPFLLAGGLTAENVQSALREVAAIASGLRGVDVSSGIEDRPGYKNRTKLAAFIEQVRAFYE